MAHADSGSMWGLKSSAQAAFFGLSCAALGAVVASLCWASLELEPAVSPRLVETRPVSKQTSGSEKGLFETAASKECVCDHCTAGKAVAHNHECDDCVFCKARAKKAAQVAEAPGEVPFVPIHRRPGYRVHSPDILFITVTLADGLPVDKQPITGEHLVRPDGKIDLGSWGEVPVEDKTVDEIKHAIEQLVEAEAGESFVDVSVFAQNSKVYYVITGDSPQTGDSVHRFPITGNETALDAVSQVGRLNDLARKRIWISRPVVGGKDTVIPVTWQWTSPTTMTGDNPPLMPGDRVFVHTPPGWVTFVELAAKAYQAAKAKNASAAKPAGPGYSWPK